MVSLGMAGVALRHLVVQDAQVLWIADGTRVWRSATGGAAWEVGWFATERGTWITVNGGMLWRAQGSNPTPA